MKISKIRRTSESSADEDLIYIDYSSLPTDSQNKSEESERFFMSVQRKELTPAKKAYVESTQTKPDAPFADAQPKGLYSEPGVGVVDDYAARTDWRDRIQKAVSESESRFKPHAKEPTPWPEAPYDRQKIVYPERIFEEIKPETTFKDEITLWEIDEKITSKEPFFPETESEGKKGIRAEAYTTWLAERNVRLAAEDAQLKINVAANLKKQKRAEAHEQWLAEREERIAAGDAQLKKDIAANLKKQKYSEAHDKWLAEREVRLAAEDAQLKSDVAAHLKKQKLSEAYNKWFAEREARLAAEDAQLKATVAANLKKQKHIEAHEQWLAEREARIAVEDAQLKAYVAAVQKKQKRSEAYDLWCAERQKRIEAEEHDLLEKVREKKAEGEEFMYSNELKPEDALSSVLESELKEIETEFEAVFDETVDQMFETVSEDDNSVIEVYDETKDEIIVESQIKTETDASGELEEPDEEYDADLQALLSEKKSLEQLRVKAQNLDDEFVV